MSRVGGLEVVIRISQISFQTAFNLCIKSSTKELQGRRKKAQLDAQDVGGSSCTSTWECSDTGSTSWKWHSRMFEE
nr:hypothetical protein CFP56_31081 [Quercus suber]